MQLFALQDKLGISNTPFLFLIYETGSCYSSRRSDKYHRIHREYMVNKIDKNKKNVDNRKKQVYNCFSLVGQF